MVLSVRKLQTCQTSPACLPEAGGGERPDDGADVAGHVEDEGRGEDPEEVDDDVVSLLPALHYDAAPAVYQLYLTQLHLVLK